MESVICTREEVRRFLSINSGSGSGYGSGSGSGSGSGYGGYGSGSGSGSGSGYGGSGSGYGSGYGDGYGGSGYGDGSGSGSGSGSGYGDGYGGSGSGYGSGYGYGYGDGDGDLKTFNGRQVDYIDAVPTILVQIRGNVAKAYMVNADFTVDECYVVKVGNSFAHGDTIHDAQRDAEAKELENMPVEERVDKFIETFGSLDSEHTGREFYDWHHVLTGSCTMGRDEFCKAHNVKMDATYTVGYFLDITKSSYGGDVIRMVMEKYNSKQS